MSIGVSTTIYEGQSLILTVSFYNEANALTVPTTATYQIDDVYSGKAILAATSFPSLASSVTIHLTPAQNALVDSTRDKETRRVTFTCTYGAGAAYTGTLVYLYKIVRVGSEK